MMQRTMAYYFSAFYSNVLIATPTVRRFVRCDWAVVCAIDRCHARAYMRRSPVCFEQDGPMRGGLSKKEAEGFHRRMKPEGRGS